MTELVCNFGAKWDRSEDVAGKKKLRLTLAHALKLFSNSWLHTKLPAVS